MGYKEYRFVGKTGSLLGATTIGAGKQGLVLLGPRSQHKRVIFVTTAVLTGQQSNVTVSFTFSSATESIVCLLRRRIPTIQREPIRLLSPNYTSSVPSTCA
ncbi:hypothetical protein SCLCIDRAFT_469326 [Scleroderma citrinum Foug A]|uniref:Uncharacterized protein n=1 Tax=Scleroderma citrinum Foug A TaxID=1036808 RepID=A0A0C3EAU5_9AGAM|nr:hypothetical protein SCLCIDRAFT_469326 [Scleroderma citrinum Foug A]